MAKVSATSSLGLKVSLSHKKGFGTYDNASPHHSISIEREVSDDLTDEELVEKASELNAKCRKLVEDKMGRDLKELRKND